MIDFDNAFDPDNDHLWAQCETHKRDNPSPKRCIFVENCDACQVYCLHDAPLSLRRVYASPKVEGDYVCECGWNRIVLDGETMDDAKIAHEKTEIHRLAMRYPETYGPEV